MRDARIEGRCDSSRGGGRWRIPAYGWASILSMLLGFLSVDSAAAQAKARNVLVVFSAAEHDSESLDIVERTIRTRVPGEVNFYTASIDYQRFGDESYRESLAETFRREYRGVKPDVVIAMAIEALEFTTEYRRRIFPGAPIVFTGVTASELDGKKMPPGVTGVEGLGWTAGDWSIWRFVLSRIQRLLR